MQSLVLTQSGLRIADTPMPPAMPGEARIEIRSVGICGTDIAIWKGDFKAQLPLVLGHEFTGVIHESTDSELNPGTLVTSEIDLFCGRCWYCQNNLRHLCIAKETLGISADGGLSEYISVPVENIHPLPEGVDALSGTFVEPLASTISTFEKYPIKPDETVIVIGSGKLGILLAQVLDVYGANVYVIGRNRLQLGLVRRLGLRNTINITEENWKKAVYKVTDGVGPRIVAEATGNPDGLKMASEIVRSGGVIAAKSMHGMPVQIDPTHLVDREITLFGSSRGDFRKAIEMLSQGRVEVKQLISRQFKLEDGAKAFEYASQPGVGKVIVNI
jgi:alcohol dehydrogenase